MHLCLAQASTASTKRKYDPYSSQRGLAPLRQVALLSSSLRVKITTKHYKQEENMKKQISRQRGGRVGLYVIQW